MLLLAILLGTFSPGYAVQQGDSSATETEHHLKEVEQQRKQLQEKLSLARQKERLAMLRLQAIQSRLNVTTHALHQSQHKLVKTEHKINETQKGIETTRVTQAELSVQAARRLREIYEGQRLSQLEMFLRVNSLQSLLDLFYYQEKVAESDRKLLEQLKAQAIALAAKKTKLGQQRNLLGDLISEFARKALLINQEKLNQQQIAERLKTQRAFYEQAERQLALESERLEQQIQEMESASEKSTKGMATGSGRMSLPLKAQITSPFGWRRHPIFGVRKFHTGIDLAGPNHSAIQAADSGNVLYTGWYGGYGKVVILSHGRNQATLYAHLAGSAVSRGANVHKGQVIGYEGTTGFSTGPHLHFEVRLNGKPNNPLNYVR